MVTLSPRLRTAADMAQEAHNIIDVGCDHGYLSIYLLTNGIASSVIAADINEGPLQSAVLNTEKFDVKEKE